MGPTSNFRWWDDPVDSERLAREALEIGRANANVDLELLAMTAVGAALVQQGRTSEGTALLDEAMAAALAGECGNPLTAAHASCMTTIVRYPHAVGAIVNLDGYDALSADPSRRRSGSSSDD
jgi:hypothetical protein